MIPHDLARGNERPQWQLTCYGHTRGERNDVGRDVSACMLAVPSVCGMQRRSQAPAALGESLLAAGCFSARGAAAVLLLGAAALPCTACAACTLLGCACIRGKQVLCHVHYIDAGNSPAEALFK